MSCEHCVNAVTTELNGLHGVSAVTIALVPDGVSRVTVASDLPLPADAISGALDEAGGYQVVVVGQELTGESGAPDGAKHRR